MSLAAILEFPKVIVQRDNRLERNVIKLLRRVRPDWPKEDIILQRFLDMEAASADPEAVFYGGYTEDRNEMMVIKIFSQDNPVKV